MKQYKQLGQTSSNAKKYPSNEKSHKRKECNSSSDKTELLDEEKNSEDSTDSNTLQKLTPKAKKGES